MACGAQDIKNTIMEHLDVADGGTTPDGQFTLLEVECLGACSNAPMVQINDDFYENLTPKTTVELLELCKQGKPPPMNKWGSLPMNGQMSCEGPLGKTSLFTIPGPGHGMRPDADLEALVDPVSVKEHMSY
jgi:NADH dehydrogenase (ubiquinone) flavoprotein 2